MTPAYDPNDLTDAQGVAEILGLSKRGAVSVYRSRYPDFPEPVLDLGRGRPMLWLRADVERWAKARRRRTDRPRDAAKTRWAPNTGESL